MSEPREVQAYADITNIRPEGEVDFRPSVSRAEMINHPTAGWAQEMTFAERTEAIRRDRALAAPTPPESSAPVIHVTPDGSTTHDGPLEPVSEPEPVAPVETAPEPPEEPEPAQEAVVEPQEAENAPVPAADSAEITLEWADDAPDTVQGNVEETKNIEEDRPSTVVDDIKARLLARANTIADAGQGRELRAELDTQGLPRIGEASLDQLLAIEATIIEFEAKLQS